MNPRKAAAALIATLAIVGVFALPATAAAPVVSVEDATEVAYTTAHVKGEVNPEGQPTTWRLQYSTQADFSSDVNTVEEEGTESAKNVDRQVTGLAPDTTYYLRLQAENGDGQTEDVTSPFETKAVAKPAVTIPLVSQITSDSAHFTAEVDPSAPTPNDPAFDASWHFECTPGCPGLLGGTVSGAPEAVADDAIGLHPGTEYTVTIVATNMGGEEKKSETFKTATAVPLVTPFEAGPLTATSAQLNGQVNPEGEATVYWFEWGAADCAASSCQSLPAGKNAYAGSGFSNEYVTEELTNLQPQTTYHFRLMAKNATGPTAGPDQTFTTPATDSGCANAGLLGTDRLPDCRAWEMASPPDKNGGDVLPTSSRTRAAADGDAVNFASLVGFGDVHGLQNATDYIAERGATPGTSGWGTHGITPAQQPLPLFGAIVGGDSSYMGEMSADLSAGAFRSYRPLADAPDVAGQINLYARRDLRSPGLGTYQLLTDPGFPLPTPAFPDDSVRPFLAGASADFTHLIFESKLNLDPRASGGEWKLYESDHGALRLAGILPDGDAAPSSRAGLGAAPNPLPTYTPNMISADGSRVFFQAQGHAYMRVNGSTTVQLDASERTIPEASPGSSAPETASADGSRIFFASVEALVDEDKDHGSDYYMYDVKAPAGHHLTLISKDGEPSIIDSAAGIIGASEDGHYLYFSMNGQLIAGEKPLIKGLYAWHDGTVKYIGNFAEPSDMATNSLGTPWNLLSIALTSRVSVDGTHLIFLNTDDSGFQGRGGLVGFDHTGPVAAGCGEGCGEIYVYDAQSGRLRCASCDPSEAEPVGYASLNTGVGGYGSNAATTSHLSHALSGDGRWVFFNSPDPLVPEDINGAVDAYQYNTETEEISLISSGSSNEGSYFLDASASGRDVFFVTREALSEWDTDGSYDLYDARVGGGLPEPAPRPAPCEGESCLPAPAAGSAAVALGSQKPGPGNRKPPCPKGRRAKKVHGKVRCFKRRHHRRPHHRPAAEHGGAK